MQIFALGVLADLIAAHRVVSQRTLERVRRIELALGVAPSHYVAPPPAREVLRDTSEDVTGVDARRVEVVTVSTAATSD